MTEADVLALINTFIVANANNEITADVLRPILVAMLEQPNDKTGELVDLDTTDKSNIVNAINEILNTASTTFEIHSGANNPNTTPPASYSIGDWYIRSGSSIYQFNGDAWILLSSSSTISDTESFLATEGQTVFTLSSAPVNVDVWVNDVYQQLTHAYTFSGNTVTLNEAITLNDRVVVRKYEQNISGAIGFTSPLTTKGDILTYDTDNQRLGVGTDGQFLTADSTEPTGLKWNTPAGGGDMLKTENLSGLTNYATARTNLGISWTNISTKKWSLFGDSTSSNGSPNLATVVSTILGLTGTDNNAVPGNRIDEQVTALDALLTGDAAYFLDYDIVTILVGANDFAQNIALGSRYDAVGASTVAGQMLEFIEKVYTSNPEVELYIMTPWENEDYFKAKNAATIPWSYEDLAQLYNEIAFDNKIQVIDLNKISSVNPFTFSTYITATVHLSADGINHVAQIIANAFISQNNTPVSFSSIKQIVKSGNFTLGRLENDNTIAMDGGICTIDPDVVTYQDAYVVAMKNTTESTNGTISCEASTGWTYKLNSEASVASGSFSLLAGATCTIIKYAGTNKIYIDGGVE